MRIGIVGGGVSGLVCAYLLQHAFDLTIFESEQKVGGHTNTVSVNVDQRSIPVDTGFIVFNRRNYPNFSTIIDRLGVRSQPTTMSFSVRSDVSGLEYGGASINGLFAQRRNLVNRRFLGLLRDIVRFNKEAPAALASEPVETSVGEFVRARGYGDAFRDEYLVPMAAAVWSCDVETVDRFPLHFLVRFFENHGMLTLRDRPQWETISGGSYRYVEALTAGFADRIRVGDPVCSVSREGGGVRVNTQGGVTDLFDQIIIASHSDQALSMLEDASEEESRILGAIPYTTNDTVLHNDASLLPRRKRAWAAWNYHVLRDAPTRPIVTYNLSQLQNLQTIEPLCVTLNETDAIDPARVLERLTYAHPRFSPEAWHAQQDHHLISGVNSTHYCGAYWGYGFHEDGVNSALRVCRAIGVTL